MAASPIRILHLDDNPLDAQLVALTLEVEQEKFPTTLKYVQTKEEYLAALARKDFDIILSDYRMPGYDGDLALAAAQEHCPDIPFIMVTGELGEEMVIETLKRGATDYVLKDRIFRLVPAIRRALDEGEMRRRRREAEEEARKAHREASEILESVQDPFYVVDAEWHFTYVNSVLEQLLGRSRRELLGNSIWDAFPQILGTESERVLRQAMQERRLLHCELQSAINNAWIEVHLFPKADGGLSVLYRDISKRKAQEQALRSSEDRFRATFRESPYPTVLSRVKDGVFTDANDAYLSFLGVSREDLIGHSSFELGLFSYPDERTELVRRLEKSGTVHGFEMHLRTRAQGERLVRLSVTLLRASNDGTMLSIVTDITEGRQAEEALRASEAMLDAFFANSPGILNLQDEEFRYLKTDSMTPTYFKLDRQSIVGKAVADLAPEFIKEFGPMMRRVMETGEPVTDAEVFSPVPGRPGEVSHWRASYFRVSLPGGRYGIGIMGVDITDMKRTEATMRRLKEEYYLMVEQQTDMVARMSREGRRLYVNRNFLGMVGKTEEEVLNSDYAPEIHPEDAPRVAEEWTRTFEPPHYRSAITCRTNTVLGWRWLSWRNTALFDEKGEPTIAISVGRDVTEMVQAEETLKKVNEDLRYRNLELEAERVKWQRLIEGIADEIWSCDAAGKMSLMNLVTHPAMQLQEFTERTIEQVNEEVDILNTDGTLRAAEDAPLLQALKGRIVRGEEIMSHRTTGVRRYRQYSAVPVHDAEGRIVGSVAIVRDITQARQSEMEAKRAEQAVRLLNQELEERVQKRTKALEEANRELEAFSYSVSHDLKAPLRLIAGFADLLVRQGQESLTEKQKDSLATIQAQAARMDELIKALLEFSRLTRKGLQFVGIETKRMVEDVVAEQRQVLGGETGERVLVEVAELPNVEADPILLRMVFTNLLSNAFKFTRTVAHPKVTIDAKEIDGFWNFRIQDNGVGFPKGQTERLFQVFQRLHGIGEYEGTGIGLANVRKIVERHGGQVCGDGEEGKGAAFFFTLPVKPRPSENSENRASRLAV